MFTCSVSFSRVVPSTSLPLSGDLRGVLRGDTSIGDMRAIPVVAALPSRSVGFSLLIGAACRPKVPRCSGY